MALHRSPGAVRRALTGVLATAAVALVVVPAVSVGAQEEESPDVEDVEEIPAVVETPQSTLLPPQTVPTTRLPQACRPIDPADVVFVGRVAAYQLPTFRFDVLEVRAGEIAGPQVDVAFPGDDRFVELGGSYLVAAHLDPSTGVLSSKVKQSSKTLPAPGTCPGDDPIITRNADGTPVDTGVLKGMKGRWAEAGLAFVVPAAGMLGLLVVLVGLKHGFGRLWRAPVG